MLTSRQFVKKIFEDIKSNWFLPVTEHQVYSTAETVVGTWANGKPLYGKTIVLENVTLTGTESNIGTLPENIDFCNVKSAVGVNGGLYEGIGVISVWVRKTANDFGALRNQGSATYSELYISIEYTKTTDTASSNKAPFEPLVEYSLEEKMVGYWIDGKTIYRKTVDFGALPNNNTKTVAHGISDFGKIVDLRGVATNNSSNTTLAIPHPGNTLNNMISINITDTNVTIITGSNRSAYYCTVTLYYTKTTE